MENRKTAIKLETLTNWLGDSNFSLGCAIREATRLTFYDQYWGMTAPENARLIRKVRTKPELGIMQQTPECIHHVYCCIREVRDYRF